MADLINHYSCSPDGAQRNPGIPDSGANASASGLQRQRGLALITAMLVVAIAATTAVYLGMNQQVWLRRAQNFSDRSQAEAVRAGALEWAIVMLAKDARDSQSDDLTENWAEPLPPIAVEGGQVTGRITDAQGKFNLNNLVRNGAPSAPDIGVFQHLLLSLEIDANLADAVVDWMDADSTARPYGAEDIDYLQTKTPYRAANQPMQSVNELRLVRGFTPEIVEKLRPWITALPQPTEINVNTAPQEVLSALFYTLPASAAEQLMAQRPYADQAKLAQKLQELAADASLPQAFYGVQSGYFEVTVEARFGRYRRTTVAMVLRAAGEGPSRVLWHGQRLTPEIATSTASAENPDASSGGNI